MEQTVAVPGLWPQERFCFMPHVPLLDPVLSWTAMEDKGMGMLRYGRIFTARWHGAQRRHVYGRATFRYGTFSSLIRMAGMDQLYMDGRNVGCLPKVCKVVPCQKPDNLNC